MDNLFLHAVDASDLRRYERWLHESSILFGSAMGGLASGVPLAWQAKVDGEVVGIARVADHSRIGYLELAVKPDVRRRGVGTQILMGVLNDPSVRKLRRLRARISPSNTGAQKVLIKNGFSKIGFSPEGLIEFDRRTD